MCFFLPKSSPCGEALTWGHIRENPNQNKNKHQNRTIPPSCFHIFLNNGGGRVVANCCLFTCFVPLCMLQGNQDLDNRFQTPCSHLQNIRVFLRYEMPESMYFNLNFLHVVFSKYSPYLKGF